MSHFTVLVVTESEPSQDDLAAVLQPFHEFECTGIDDEFVQSVSVTDEEMGGWQRHKDAYPEAEKYIADFCGYSLLRGDSDPDLGGDHKYGFARVAGGVVTEVVRRTNPNNKWDWWVVGGRWSGLLPTHTGGGTNSAQVADIDLDALKGKRTFAVLSSDGKWHERGRMGWWAVVHDEQPEGEWNDWYDRMLDRLPETAWLTVVDCHI